MTCFTLGLAVLPWAVSTSAQAEAPSGVKTYARPDEVQNVAEARLTLEARAMMIEELTDFITTRCRESFFLSPPQRKLLTMVSIQEGRAADLLIAIERMTGLFWWEVDVSYWQLARDRKEAAVLYSAPPGKPGPESVSDFGRIASGLRRRLVRSITPDQWRRMEGGVVLQFGELSAQQQQLLLGSLEASRFGGSGSSSPTREAREGRVAIYLTDTLDIVPSPGLAFAYPSRLMPGYEPRGKSQEELRWATGVFIAPNPDGNYSPSNPGRRLYPPGRAPRRPADPTPEEDRTDPRLQRTLDLGSEPPSWEKLVAEMQKATGLAVFLAGDYLKKPAPFAVDRMRVIEVMDRLAEETGRRWERIGDLRLLAPLPKKEERPRQAPASPKP